ncbi:MAG: aminoacyl-tRNA hydrolase [Chloroflexi bacterium]|nr:aminoacyl-tRNA hydrolase [Chloroflexota bacterium]
MKSNGSRILIAGLGNPGAEYRNNRHNAGFMVLDEIASRLDEKFKRLQSNALVIKSNYKSHRLILAKPRTYMNLSGNAVAALVRFYKLPFENVLIIYDDVDLPWETIRLRASGGAAGQKGMRSIIEKLGTQAFPRMRIGISRPKGRMSTPSHVLQDFSKEELEILPFVIVRAADAAFSFVEFGVERAMNDFNQSV